MAKVSGGMTLNDLFCIDLPNAFPAESYEKFWLAAGSVMKPEKGPAWAEFARASNLIGWRFRASREHLDDYLRGGDQSHEDVYRRERALFGMFTSGVSCIESTCYAIYALASHPSVLGLDFGAKQQRHASPGTLRTALEPHHHDASVKVLADLLDDLNVAGEWELWRSFRNRMSHRSNLPRHISGSVGAAQPPRSQPPRFARTSSTASFRADRGTLDDLFPWLVDSLRELLSAGGDILPAPE